MSALPPFLDPLQNHRQLEQDSCAVSGFECIAKLHGLIGKEEFSLQSDETNQGKGFGETEFLESLGIFASDSHHDIESALDLIETETSRGRFPLVSCITKIEQGMRYWHIKICAQNNAKLVLINPAYPMIVAEKREGLKTELEKSILPDRTKLHMLTYTLETQ